MNLHQQLAEAQRAQRDAEDTFKLVKAITEQRAIDAVSGSYGKNADERERFLILALAGDTNYARALVRLRRAEQAVDQLKAALATQEDDRRAYEWPVRAALEVGRRYRLLRVGDFFVTEQIANVAVEVIAESGERINGVLFDRVVHNRTQGVVADLRFLGSLTYRDPLLVNAPGASREQFHDIVSHSFHASLIRYLNPTVKYKGYSL
jgi:hypothetical protein